MISPSTGQQQHRAGNLIVQRLALTFLVCLTVLQGILFGSLHVFEQLVLPPVDKQQADS